MEQQQVVAPPTAEHDNRSSTKHAALAQSQAAANKQWCLPFSSELRFKHSAGWTDHQDRASPACSSVTCCAELGTAAAMAARADSNAP